MGEQVLERLWSLQCGHLHGQPAHPLGRVDPCDGGIGNTSIRPAACYLPSESPRPYNRALLLGIVSSWSMLTSIPRAALPCSLTILQLRP